MKLRVYALIIMLTGCLSAQNFSDGFNFNLPWNDSASQVFLPEFTIQKIDYFVSINENGRFSVNGTPIRFWGANLVADGAFPENNEADAISGRLRKMGFNLIRFHHLDNSWSTRNLFAGQDNTLGLNPFYLDMMEYLISALKVNGIYINMNLNVSRQFKKNDGVPDADSLLEFGKGVTIFDPQLISLQKSYARQLLTHINPYTGLALSDDPVMAMVEIINENSLYRMWRNDDLKLIADGGVLISRHNRMLDSLFNAYLLDKYSSTQNLAASWNTGIFKGETGNQVINGNFELPLSGSWTIELHESALAEISRDNNNPYEGLFSGKVSVTKATGTTWHIQFKQVNLKIKKDSVYTISFAARSDNNKSISVTVINDQSPWTWYGGTDFNLTPDWNKYSFSIKSSEDCNTVRVSFAPGETGNYWFDNITFSPPEIKGLLPGETLENKNVARIDYTNCLSFSDNRVKDISEFYIKLQDDFFSNMRDFLKNTLGVKVPIVGTNWNVGPGDLISQSSMDYIDNHAYWDHPQFPNEPWSATDWFITNQPMVTAKTGFSIAELFAGSAVKNKPYTVSELNDCFPNRYQTESLIFTTSYFSFHNADAVMFFEYNGASDWGNDKIESYFSLHRNPAMMSLMPSCAYAYRNNFIAQANETVELNYSKDQIYLLPKNDDFTWTGPALFPKRLALIKSFRNNSFNSVPTDFSDMSEPASPYRSDTGEIIWNTDGIITVNTKKFIGAAGFLNNFPGQVVGNLRVENASDFLTLTWISLTGDSLVTAEKSLFTISSVAQNTGMIWDGITTFHNNWGSSPTLVKPILLTAGLNIAADSVHVFPLDNTGKVKAGSEKIYLPVTKNNFEITFDQNTDKTLWYGIQKYGDGNTTGLENNPGKELNFNLEQNYPNPFNNETIIKYSVPEDTRLKIIIFSTLGEVIASLYNDIQHKGNYQLSWDGKNNSGSVVSSGTYIVYMNAGEKSVSKKMILLK